MNKIYRVIWSKAKNCYVVVSELAKRNGKCSSSLNKKMIAAFLAGGLLLGIQGEALAAGTNSTAIGYGDLGTVTYTTSTGQKSIAVGYYASTSTADSAIAIGTGTSGTTKNQKGPQASAEGAIAIGSATEVKDTTTGKTTKYAGASATEIYAIAVGTASQATGQDSIAVGRSSLATGQDAVALGRSSQATAQDTVALGRSSGALAIKSVAVGATAKVDSAATGSVVVGYGARALTTNSLLLGYNAGYARPSPDYTAAGTASDGDGAIAIGYKATLFTYGELEAESSFANVKNSIAIGTMAHSHAAYTVSIGYSTDASGERGFAIGTTSTDNSGSHHGARAAGQGSIAFGDQAMTVTDVFLNSSEPGHPKNRARDLNTNDSIAIGTMARSMANNAVTMGGNVSYSFYEKNSKGEPDYTKINTIYGFGPSGERGALVGDQADAAIAIGGAYGTVDYENNTITIENEAASAYGKRSIALGSGATVISKATKEHIENITNTEGYRTAYKEYLEAYGVYQTRVDEKNDADAYRDAVYSNPGSTAEERLAADNAVTVAANNLADAEQTYHAKFANYEALRRRVDEFDDHAATDSRDAIAIGTSAEASLYESIAIGKSALTGDVAPRSIAFGTNAKTGTYAQSSIAFGTGAETGTYAIGSIAFGVGSKTGSNAIDSVAIGINSNANKIRTIAIGKDSKADADHATAIGMTAEVYVINGVAIGSQSIATLANDRAGTVSGIVGYDVGTDKAFAGDGRFMPTWMSTAGSFSVGGGTNEEGEFVTRRITNVAAGASDTEAVNVAQLRRAVEQTVMTSDNRIVGVGKSPVRGLEIISPFYEIKADMAKTTEAMSFMSRHNNSVDQYKTDLNKELYGEGGTATNPKENSLQGHLNKLKVQKQYLVDRWDELDDDIKNNLTPRINVLKAKEDAYNAGTSNIDLTAAEKQELISKIEEKTEKELELVYINQEIDEKTKEITNKTTEVNDKKAELDNAGNIFANQEALYDNRAEAKGDHAIAAGIKAKAYGKESIAYGKGSVVGKVDNDGNPIAGKGDQSIALGVNNTVTGNNSIAVGTGLTVSGNNSGAFGDPSEINSANSYSVGNENKIGTGYTDVFALGNHITRVESNSVFLGSNSGYVPADNSTTAGVSTYGSMTINDHVYPFAGGGNHVVGVVSVGSNENGELKTRRIQNVAPGLISADSTDAINGSQLYQAMQALSIDVKGDPTETMSTNVEKSKTPAAETTPAAGGAAAGGAAAGGGAGGGAAGTTMEIKLTPATTYTVTASTTTVKAGSKNIKVEEKIEPENPKSYKYTIDLAKDINVDSVTAGDTVINKDGVKANKFTAGNTTINNDGLTIEGGSSPVNLTNAGLKVGGTTVNDAGVTIQNGPGLTKDGIDAGGKKITNVAPGENDTDAVNVSQLRNSSAETNQAINMVDSRSRKGIAGAAALAALHPMDFDPDDKLTFAAGVGNFRGETAAAIGAFYRPDEKVMFSIGGTFGNSENLVNAGISFSLDRKSRVTGSRTAMAKEIVELREQVAQLTALVHQIAGNQGLSLPMPPAMFPNTPENKWAYDYIESLQKQGVLSGYAGRELTRNEMAAALDRALASGAKLDERITREFAPELSRIRVVYVNGQVDGEPRTFERPRSSVHEYK